MTATDFCYWLQGVFEGAGLDSLNKKQTEIVKEHLALVFWKVTGKPAKPAPVQRFKKPRACAKPKHDKSWDLAAKSLQATLAKMKGKQFRPTSANDGMIHGRVCSSQKYCC